MSGREGGSRRDPGIGDRAVIASQNWHFRKVERVAQICKPSMAALGTSLGRSLPSLSLSLRICGFPVKVILQTQQRLKEGERGEGGELWHGGEETE